MSLGDLLKQNTGKDITQLKHGGAAGGITAAMHALTKRTTYFRFEYCLTLSHFHDNLLQAGVVIHGEGKIDLNPFMVKFREQLQTCVRNITFRSMLLSDWQKSKSLPVSIKYSQ